MDTPTDPRIRALLDLTGDRLPQALLEWLLHSFEALEQIDFGELEPVGVASPTDVTPRK
jgi:hypothetical protein